MSQVDASIPLSVKQPDFMSPSQVISLQAMAQQMQQRNQLYQQEQQDRQRDQLKQKFLTEMQADPEIRDAKTGMYTPKGILKLAIIDPAMADKAAEQRSVSLQHNAQQRKAEIDAARDAIKVESSLITDIYREAYAKASVLKATPENKQQAFQQALKDQVDELHASGRLSELNISPAKIDKILTNQVSIDSVPMLLSNVQKMVERADSFGNSQAVSGESQGQPQSQAGPQPAQPQPTTLAQLPQQAGQVQPGQPPQITLQALTQAAQANPQAQQYTNNGVVVPQLQNAPQMNAPAPQTQQPLGVSLADIGKGQVQPNGDVRLPESTVTGKPGLESPDELRKKAQILEARGNPSADKQAKAYRSEADRLDNIILREGRNADLKEHQENQDANSKAREERLSAVRNSPAATLRPEDAKLVAQRFLAGDKSAAQGFARNQQAQVQIAQAITDEAKRAGISAKEIVAKQAEYHGIIAGENTLGRREANLATSVEELKQFIPLAEKASAAVPRTAFVPINKLIQMGENQWSPEQAAFVASNRAIINAFASIASRSGNSTVHNTQEAEKMLNTAYSPEMYTATLKQLWAEAQGALRSPRAVRQDMHDQITGKERPEQPYPAAKTPKTNEDLGKGLWK